MDWKIFLTTLSSIFILEMGDKTQLTALTLSAQHEGKWEVLVGIILGLVLAGLLAFFAGRILSAYVPDAAIRYTAGSVFILVGLWVLLKP